MANTALALSYAALILVDSKLNITEENIDKLVSKVHSYNNVRPELKLPVDKPPLSPKP